MIVGLQNDIKTGAFINFDDKVYIHATIKKTGYVPVLANVDSKKAKCAILPQKKLK
jgi:hypothetical protein